MTIGSCMHFLYSLIILMKNHMTCGRDIEFGWTKEQVHCLPEPMGVCYAN